MELKEFVPRRTNGEGRRPICRDVPADMQQPEPDRSLDSANDSVLVSLNDLCQAARGRCTSLFNATCSTL